MKHKSAEAVEATGEGQVSAVVATYDVVDHDGDIVVAGAIPDGTEVRMSAYNHASWGQALPVGKGVMRDNRAENRAEFHGQMFMDTQAGRETFAVIKGMGDLQEYSWGFDIVEADSGERDGQQVQFIKATKTHEVSPVLLGAGIGTQTLGLKMKLAEHGEAVLTDVRDLVERAVEVVTLRREQGKSLGKESTDVLAQLKSEVDRLTEVLEAPQPDNDQLVHELARFERTRAIISQGGDQ